MKVQPHETRPFNAFLSLPVHGGFIIIWCDSITHFSSDKNLSIVHLINGEKSHIYYPLKTVEEKLYGRPFYRIHHQVVVNLCHIIKFVKTDGGLVILDSGVSLPVSRERRKGFVNFCNQL